MVLDVLVKVNDVGKRSKGAYQMRLSLVFQMRRIVPLVTYILISRI
jgi:hypothetical protein